ncbi:PHD and RING finger domain-containing protein 1 isoform 2-T2 [Leptodactylus fuscus]|uniref:PHD and RING finger domain-containing protein 1 isoform X2 n=1 Tax=Leptodactylus fuscus TaxID=238119 RepID=UPI003F4EE3CB
MDDEENQDQLINRNTSQGKSRRQGPFVASDDEDVEESDGSASEEEDDMDEEDGEEEDGSESEDEDDEDEEGLPVESLDPVSCATDLNEAMSSDEERENCPICLNGFRDQVVGTPENCNHYFCLDCIVEWAKNANSCPVDRITFSCIHIRAHYGGEILKKVPIQSKANENLAQEEDSTNCEICGRSDREDRLLLCDGCDAGYHMECLTPPLNAIPVDEWFCPECAATNQPQDEAVSEEEVANLLADVVPTTSRLRASVVRTRAIARTRQSERVRATVNRIRTTARTSQNVPRYLLSSLLDETIEAVVAGLNTAVYQRNLAPRTTTRRKRRTGKKTGQAKDSKGSRGVRKRRKRRVKRRKGRKQIKRKVPTSHSRIARSLGICSPQRGSSIPRIQRAPDQTLGSMRNDIGAAAFSVFGNPNDLDPFDSNDDQVSNPSSPLTAKRKVLSRSALRSHQPVARPISVGLTRGRASPLASGSVAVAEPVPDLLGSILSGQSMLMMKSSDILISRDGSLKAKKSGEISSQNSKSREDISPSGFMEPSPSHSGSPTISSSTNTWKPVVQQPHVSFPSSGLYSLSPSPSPPPASPSSGIDRLSVPNSSTPGISSFRLKNAFTPRVVQVQSSAGRLASKGAEPCRLNGALHKPESPTLNNPIPPKPPEVKHPSKPPAKRLEISEFPRIPKIKKETDISPINESSKRLDSASSSATSSLPRPSVNQLTGRGEGRQLGRFATTENTEKNTRQESQAPSRQSGPISSSHTTSSSSKAPLGSNASRNVGSSDSGGGGFRITISGSSSNSCRQFSPSAKDPFRTSEGKTQQKASLHCASNIKREKTVKNEIYDPFEPTGSDSGSEKSSPERPPTPPVPSTSSENTSTAQSSGVKVGAFRSFKLTTHASRVGISKLGPDFSGLSPNNKEPQETKSPGNVSPVSPPPLKEDKEIKKEIKEEKTEHTPFRLSCPLSGLKITSDLKGGGTRGFHFDVEDEPKISIKTEPDILPHRTFLQSTASNRVVWEEEDPSESSSLSITHSIEPQKRKITVKEEPKSCSRSRSKTRSRERESRSASLSTEDKERERRYKSKSHKVKRSRSDRSSSGSCERTKKKRQKEKKKEKKRKNSESRERRKSRSSSRSSSSHRAYNSKKKKKKKRESRSESTGRRSVSPEKEKKRKHKSDKSYSNKEKGSKVKDKKKPKDESRGKPKSRSQPVTKEFKSHKTRDKSPTFRDQEVTRHIVLSPNNNETTITCTVSFKSESPTVVQETKKSILLVPKEEVHERHTFQYLEDNVSVLENKDVDLSDRDEDVKIEAESPPWSPSLLDSLVPEDKEDFEEPPSPKESSPLNDLFETSVVSPQASSLSTGTEPASPKSHSPQPASCGDHSKSTAVPTVKKEDDDLQWSPSHLDDFLLNELSDDVCSVGAASPDDVDLEEAILMKREGDSKEPTVINFSKKAAIPFLQDDENSGDAGNHIDVKTTNDRNSTGEDSNSDGLKEAASSSVPKSKPQIKRVTWNLHHKDLDKTTREESLSSPFRVVQSEAWAASPKFTADQVTSYKQEPSSETSSPLNWNTQDKSLQGSVLQSVSQGSWTTGIKPQNNVGDKPEDKPLVTAANNPIAASLDSHMARERQLKDGSQIPWIATDTPVQVFPQTLPPLPLPPVFPPYAPVSEPTVPCVIQSSRTMPSQTPKPGSLATANEPKMQAASTGEGKGKSKPKKGEKVKNEEYMKKLHMQERAVEEVKLAIKPFYQKREITKDEYKEILRKAVQKICHSKSGEINPVKVVNLVKGYVDKYKHIRNKLKKSGIFEDHDLGRESPI